MSASGRNAEAGFTLLEVLIALAIAALAMTATALAIPSTQERRALREAAARLENLLVMARSQARRHAVTAFVELDLEARRVRSSTDPTWRALPREIALTVVSARELGTPTRPMIAFLADGSSSGGEIALSAGAYQETLRIAWLTGALDHATAARR